MTFLIDLSFFTIPRVNIYIYVLIVLYLVNIQGGPRNMTVAEYFKMSSSIICYVV